MRFFGFFICSISFYVLVLEIQGKDDIAYFLSNLFLVKSPRLYFNNDLFFYPFLGVFSGFRIDEVK
jgi:hypothetical protein